MKNALAASDAGHRRHPGYYWQRSPSNYANITQIDSAVVTVGADGSFTVLPHVGS